MKKKLKQVALYKIIVTLVVVGFPILVFVSAWVESGFKGGGVALALSAFVVIYMAPTIVAMLTDAPNFHIWFVGNLFGAWTGIGWVMCLMAIIIDLRNNVIRVPAVPTVRYRQAVAAR